MPATLTAPPRSPALANDSNRVVFSTSIPTAVTRPGFLVSGVGGDGDELNFRWGTSVARLTFAASPDNSGTQLRAAAGQSLADYLPQLYEGLLSIPALEAAFVFYLLADGVRMELRDALNGDLASTSSPSMTVTVFGAAGADNYPNLSAALLVFRGNDPDPIRLKAAYNRAGKTFFDLAELFPVRLGLPTLLPAAAGVQQPGGMEEYFFRYADQYGRPVQPETLQKSATFVVVAGGSGGATQLRWGNTDPQLCHGYFTPSFRPFPKPISPTQPDWVWVYVHGNADISASIVITYDDGTTRTEAVAGASVGRGLYCWPSGPEQIGLVDVDPTKTVRRYVFKVGTIAAVTYDLLDGCLPWETVIAYENGAGGIETVGMQGKAEREYGSTAQQFRRARPQVRGGDEGAVQRYQVEGLRRWTLRTGYVSANYAEHLAQVMLGRCWIVDRLTSRFLEVIPSGTLRLTRDDDDLHALQFTFTAASPDRAAHHY